MNGECTFSNTLHTADYICCAAATAADDGTYSYCFARETTGTICVPSRSRVDVRECVRAKRTKAARCRPTGEFPSTASNGVDEVITAYIERIPCEEFSSLDNFLLAN